jgi:hypothetical protein
VKEARAADLAALIAYLTPLPPLPFGSGGTIRLYLVAATSHLAEGWRERVPQLELAGDAGLEPLVRDAAAALEVAVRWESPADVIPLPAGSVERARPVPMALGGAGGSLAVRHFDPYSVVLRLVARGDEPDYVAALEYVRRGWVEPARLEALLAEVLPRFTSATLAQDPAEFRRKFRGLRQLVLDRSSHRLHTRPGIAGSEFRGGLASPP